ncbi:cupin domain-containing protein [Skermanella stibiiresistens]|uniref:cupin domain-containing protein n=1 Tax=Skermanella stibiiresistens TaxID=913326 RepID=UPI0004B7E209|nr:cupin domain-containing protein [Skermanella stibiiresistens]
MAPVQETAGDLVVKTAADYRAFRISPDDTNYMACVFDPIGEGVPFTCVVEIYDVGGKTPPNSHQRAHEMFFILKGEGRAHCDGRTVELRTGDAILLPPTSVHVIENTGASKLYALCTMVPNEDFAEMIHAGTPVALDDEDRAVLTGMRSP